MQIIQEVQTFTPRLKKLLLVFGGVCLLIILLISFIWIWPERQVLTWPAAYRGCRILNKTQETQTQCEEEGCHYTYRAVFQVEYQPKSTDNLVNTTAYDTRLGTFTHGTKQSIVDKFQFGQIYKYYSQVLLTQQEPKAAWIAFTCLWIILLIDIALLLRGFFVHEPLGQNTIKAWKMYLGPSWRKKGQQQKEVQEEPKQELETI